MSKRELTRYFKTRHTNDHHGYRKSAREMQIKSSWHVTAP